MRRNAPAYIPFPLILMDIISVHVYTCIHTSVVAEVGAEVKREREKE